MYSNTNNFWKVFSFLAVVPVYLIIFTVVYAFTNYYLMDDTQSEFTTKKIICSILFYIFALITFICHTVSMLTNPGYVDAEKVAGDKILVKLSPDPQDINPEGDTKKFSKLFCKKCNKNRPERSHHCSKCGKCVLKMDHHCPWIFNCVGFYNQKAFYLFLFYATLGDLIACICLSSKIFDHSFMHMILRPKRRMNPHADYIILEIFKSLKDPLLIIAGTCLSLAMTIGIGGLFCYQTYLIYHNMTSIESSSSVRKEDAPFFSKYKRTMIKSVIGFKTGIHWFLPIFKPNKYNNGYSYHIPDYDENEDIKKIS